MNAAIEEKPSVREKKSQASAEAKASEKVRVEAPAVAPSFLEYHEQYNCPRCGGAIAKECVKGNIDVSPDDHRTRRRVKIFCSHCDVLFEAVLLLSGDRYQIEQQPKVVSDPRVRNSFMRVLDYLRGNTQV